MASEITVQTIRGPASGANANKILIPAGQTLDASNGFVPPAGSVIQVVSSVKTDSQSTTSTSYVDVTGLSVSITPTSASSKILVQVCINDVSQSAGALVAFNLLRDSTTVTSNTTGGLTDTYDAWFGAGGSTAETSRQRGSGSLSVLDTPSSTSSLTYKVQMRVNTDTGWINRWALNTDLAAVSSITLMEIAG